MRHYLRPLLQESNAVVGTSERRGSLGQVIYERLLASGYEGALYAVNPRHETILGAAHTRRSKRLPRRSISR